jgi:Ca-activated chloride channel family protein
VSEALAGALQSLAGWQVVGFAEPGWLWLAPLWLAWLAFCGLRRARPALGWPALPEARAAGARFFDPVALATGLLRAAAGLLLVGALAGPMGSEQEVRLRHDGLDLVLAIDASGSMRALDTEQENRPETRLALAKEVVARFARHRVAEGDRVALVVFGERAFTQCPLTTDGALLASALDQVHAGMAGEATALGDALALSVKRAGGEPGAFSGTPSAGRLVVLLTDGRSNAGKVPPEIAMGLATRHRVRVHTVGIGSEGQVAMSDGRGGRRLELERHDLDPEQLRRIATSAGGRFFEARSSGDLESVYREIDRLERVEREAPPRLLGAPVPEPFLATAGGLIALQILLARIVARRVP